jgi:hypothetical protein
LEAEPSEEDSRLELERLEEVLDASAELQERPLGGSSSVRSISSELRE